MSNKIMELAGKLAGKLAGISNGYGINAATLGGVIVAEAALQAEVTRVERELAEEKRLVTLICSQQQALSLESQGLKAKLEELEANERAFTRVIGERSYQEVADALARLAALEAQESMTELNGPLKPAPRRLTDEEAYELLQPISLKILDLASEWADNHIHRYQHALSVESQLKHLVRAAEAHHRIGKL